MIYFIQGRLTKLIKIGKAIDCEKRLIVLQGASPDKLDIIKQIYASDEAESFLHRCFKHLRSHGEWFNPAPDLLQFIENLPLKATIPQMLELGLVEPPEDAQRYRVDKMGPGTGLTDWRRGCSPSRGPREGNYYGVKSERINIPFQIKRLPETSL